MTLHHDNDVHDKVVVVVNVVIHDDVVVVVVVTSLTLSLTGRLRWSCHLDDFLLLVVIVNAMTTFTTAYINVVIVVDLVITRSSSLLSRVMTV